MKLTTG